MGNTLINYVEFKTRNLQETKDFYSGLFGWEFKDYGPSYTAFSKSGLEGGFELSEENVTNGALIVLYHENLSILQEQILKAGGEISKEIFSFPGGRRFHFTDPSGNELAVWSDN